MRFRFRRTGTCDSGVILWPMKLVLGIALVLAPAAVGQVPACDRTCLDRMVDSWLAAVVAHDASRVSLAANVKFVENTVPMKPGEGLWKSASAVPASFQIYVPDPVAQQVGFLGMMKENGKPIQLGLRLKVRNGQIVEAEHLIARNLPAAHIFKIRGGKIHEIEAMGFTMPYNSKTGWEGSAGNQGSAGN
jgi:hypothetical protein